MLEQLLVALVDLVEGEFAIPCTLKEYVAQNVPEGRLSEGFSNINRWLVGGSLSKTRPPPAVKAAHPDIGATTPRAEPHNNGETTTTSLDTSPISTTMTTVPVPLPQVQRITSALISVLGERDALAGLVSKLDRSLRMDAHSTTQQQQHSRGGAASAFTSQTSASRTDAYFKPTVQGSVIGRPGSSSSSIFSHTSTFPHRGKIGLESGRGPASLPPLTVINRSVETIVGDPLRCARFIHEFVEANNARAAARGASPASRGSTR